MSTKRINIAGHLIKMPMLLLYVSFFIVQLFFNFDVAATSDNGTQFFSYNYGYTGTQAKLIAKTNKAKGKIQSFRLNKRFEPKTISACIPPVIKCIIHLKEVKTSFPSSAFFISSRILLSHSLRGPPYVV